MRVSARKNVVAGLALVTALLTVTSACGGSGGKSSTAGGAKSYGNLEVGMSSLDISKALIGVAVANGCFTKEGFGKVSPQVAAGSSPVIAALNGGKINLVVTDSTSIANAISAGATNLALIGGLYYGELHAMVVSKKLMATVPAGASAVDRVKALKGHTIAVTSVGGGSDVWARTVLKSVGLTPGQDLTITAAGSLSAAVAALASGRVDAIVQTEPGTTQDVDMGYPVLFRSTDLPLFTNVVQYALVANRQSIQKDPAKYTAIMKAMICGGNAAMADAAKSSASAKAWVGQVDQSVWDKVWPVQDAAPSGPIYLAAKNQYAMTDDQLTKILSLVNVTNVTPAQLYDGDPQKAAAGS